MTSEELQTFLQGCQSVKADLNLVVISLRRRCVPPQLTFSSLVRYENRTFFSTVLFVMHTDSSAARTNAQRPPLKFFATW